MKPEKSFNTWYNDVFEKVLFQDESKRMRYQQQTQTGFFVGGKMAIDDAEHGFEQAKQSLASAGRRRHGFFEGRPITETTVEPKPESVVKKKLS